MRPNFESPITLRSNLFTRIILGPIILISLFILASRDQIIIKSQSRPPVQPIKSRVNVTEAQDQRVLARLEYFPPSGMSSDILLVKLPSDVDECLKYWRNTLVGYFVEKRLPFPVVQNITRRLWQHHRLLEVLSNNNGFFFPI